MTRLSFDASGMTTYSANGVEGTLYGGPTYTSGGLTFKGYPAVVAAGGAKQYLSLPSTAFGAFTSVSIEMWVTTAANNQDWATLFGWCANVPGYGCTNSLYVTHDVESKDVIDLGYFPYSGTWQGAISSASFSSQTHMHIVLTVAPGAPARLYKNGILIATTSVAIPAFVPPEMFYVGNNAGSTIDYGFQGSIKEFRIWGGILSPSDVSTHFLQGPGEKRKNILELPCPHAHARE